MSIKKIPERNSKIFTQSITDEDDDLRISFAGFEFNLSETKWVLDSETTISVSFVDKFPEKYREGIVETLTYFSEYRSAKYTSQHTVELRRFLKNTPNLDLKGLLAYTMSTPKKNREQYISVLRCFFRQMVYLDFDIPEDFMKEFNSWVLKGNEKGIPVLTQDPETGPFSELEFRAIKAGLDQKYAEGIISDREYSIAQLFAATFRRPINLKQLKVKDLIASSKALITKQPIFQINIPRAKGKGRRFRSQFKAYALIQSIGQVITKHIEIAIQGLEKKTGRKFSIAEAKELPMFFDASIVDDIKSLEDNQLMDYLKSELPHMKRSDLTYELRSITGLELRSHQPRHLLDTIASVNGMSDVLRSKWAARADPKHNKYYDHTSEEEYNHDWLEEQSSQDLVTSDEMRALFKIQISRGDSRSLQEFNTLTSLASHITEFGECRLSYIDQPCLKYRDCINCNDHVCIKGNKEKLSRLEDKYKREKLLLKGDKKAVDENVNGAMQWYQRRQLTVARSEELLQWLKNPEVKDGDRIKLADVTDISYNISN